jgi:hypothetical protein
LEIDRFTIQLLINKYTNELLPNNTIKIYNYGLCKLNKQIVGYNLVETANLGSGLSFINKLLDGKLKIPNIKLNIKKPEIQFKVFMNFMLQAILALGHLQQSTLELFHGDLKLENYLVKIQSPTETPYFTFKINNQIIKVKNIGFAVLITDFDLSSITLQQTNLESTKSKYTNHNIKNTNKQFRLIPPILFKPFLKPFVNSFQKQYANEEVKQSKNMELEHSFAKNGLKLHHFAVSYITPAKISPDIIIYRAAGVSLFRDVDLYVFFTKCLAEKNIRDYTIANKLHTSILSFMSDAYYEEAVKIDMHDASVNWSFSKVIDIFNKIDQPMNRIFTNRYLNSLKLVNYKLFGKL